MNYIYDINSSVSILLDDFFCMIFSSRSTRLSCQKNSYILFIEIFSILNGNDILLDDIIGFCIYWYNDDMFETFCSFLYRLILIPVFFFETQEIQIGTKYIKIGFKYLHRPIGNIECYKKKSCLIVNLHQNERK